MTGLLPRSNADANLELHQAVNPRSSSTDTANLTIHKTDFSFESIKSLFDEIHPDAVFTTFSAGSFETQKSIIDAAISAGTRRFIASEFGQDSQNTLLQQRLPPLEGRAKVIAYLKELSKDDRIQWAAVATGLQLDQALISGNIGFDLKWQSATIHGTGGELFAASSTSWNGKIARAILQHWNHIHNQYIYAPGLITSANACLAALQDSTRQEWMQGKNDVEDLIREAEQRMHRGFPDAGMFLLEKSVLCDESLGAVVPFETSHGRAMLGLQQGEDLAVVVERAVHDFRHHGKGDCGCG